MIQALVVGLDGEGVGALGIETYVSPRLPSRAGATWITAIPRPLLPARPQPDGRGGRWKGEEESIDNASRTLTMTHLSNFSMLHSSVEGTLTYMHSSDVCVDHPCIIDRCCARGHIMRLVKTLRELWIV